jgi:hypothetical protein
MPASRLISRIVLVVAIGKGAVVIFLCSAKPSMGRGVYDKFMGEKN